MEDHSLISRGVMPQEIAMQFYAVILQTPVEDLRLAVDWVESSDITLSLSDCTDSFRAFVAKKGKSISQPGAILRAFFSMEGLRVALGWQPEALVDFLSQTAREEKLAKNQIEQAPAKDALLRFFKNLPKLERIARAQKIYDGLLSNFDSCWSLVEFRPVFNKARNEIESGIITASLSLRVRNDNTVGEPYTTFSFQLDVADAEAFIEELTRVKKKIKILKTLAEKSTKLLNPKSSLEDKKGEK